MVIRRCTKTDMLSPGKELAQLGSLELLCYAMPCLLDTRCSTAANA